MSKRFKIILKISVVTLLLCAVSLGSTLLLKNDAKAEITGIQQKVAYKALGSCMNYRNNYVDNPISVEGNIFNIHDVAHASPNFIVMPTYVDGDGEDLKISCKELFAGKKIRNDYNFEGLLPSSSSRNYTPTDLGYVADGNVRDKKCIYVNYTYLDPNSKEPYSDSLDTNYVCFPVSSLGIIRKANPGEVSVGAVDSRKGALNLAYDGSNLTYTVEGAVGGGFGTLSPLSDGLSISDLEKNVYEALGENIFVVINYDYEEMVTTSNYSVHIVPEPNGNVAAGTYVLNENSALTALHFFAPNTDYTTYNITNDDYYNLYKSYMAYVTSKYGGLVSITDKCSTDKASIQYAWTDNGTDWCEVSGVAEVTEKFAGRGTGGWANGMTVMDFRQMLTSLKSIDFSRVENSSLGNINSGGPNSGVTVEEVGVTTCYSANPLSWIACPVLEAVGGATGWIYEHMIRPALEIPANSYFGSNGDDSLYGAWSTFRNFGNILFVIAFVVVILAQVTGIGISNYNIKKILPRLVMVVILVNISYIICQLAVDVSNIIGSSIETTLGNIKINGSEPDSPAAIVGMWLEGIGLAGVVGVTAATIISQPVIMASLSYLLIPLILTFVGCLIAVIFFFILLSARQAGVVILIILAPLAVICYALPNTKSLFDRWRKLFTAVLFVYPICGLLMGGGRFISGLMLAIAANGGELSTFYSITALLVSVIPFFLVPSLLRSSLAAAGNIGARIASAGSNLSNRLNSGIRNSEAYKMRQQEAARRVGIRRNQRRVGRLSTTENKAGGLYGRFRRAVGLNDNLSNRQQALLGQAQLGIDKSVGDTANAMRIGWENDGSANNIGEFDEDGNIVGGENSMLQRYMTATRELEKDPNDFGALERQRAAASVLASTAPGRSALFEANDRLGQEIVGMSGDKQMAARQVMQRTFNNLRRSNPSDLAKSALLDEQAKQYQIVSGDYDYDKISGKIMQGSIQGLSTRDMSQMNHRDLNRYLKAIQDGKIAYGSDEYKAITALAAKTLADPHIKSNLGAKEMQALNNIASTRYIPPSTGGSDAAAVRRDVTDALGGASDYEMTRLRSYLQDSTVGDAEKDRLLDSLSDTLGRSLSESSDGAAAEDVSFKVSQGRAQQIGQILSENGRKIGDAGVNYGIDSAHHEITEDRYDLAAGIRVDHGKNHRTLADRHPGWERATSDGPGYKKGDWVEKTAIELVAPSGTRTITSYEKLNAGQTREADELEHDDIRIKRMNDDEEAAAKARWGRS